MTSTVPPGSLLRAFYANFLGAAPDGYKLAILAMLAVNPLVLVAFGPFVAGWLILLEFIFTLALALKCYPLQPGGLIALEAIVLGLASPASVYQETAQNFSVVLLLMFMVAGIYFLRELLLFLFTRLLLSVRSQTLLALSFCAAAAVLSAFLDALTVIAVVITVATGLHSVYQRVVAGDALADQLQGAVPEHLRAFLRGLLMHAAIGTALGGVCTLVGEPQNLLIGELAGWNFVEFFVRVAPVSLPVFAAGLATCVALERLRRFGYGAAMPGEVRTILEDFARREDAARDAGARARLWAQAGAALLLVMGLGMHVAEVGLIGLAVVVIATALTGVIEEKRLGHAFEEALPFTALLVTFFAIVAVIHEQHLFKPVVDLVLAREGREQLVLMYVANGLLSAISDNVFVATVYISEVKAALDAGTIDRAQFDLLAVAINTGTNIPSVATPNGQAAFLFLLTSAIAPLIGLGYLRMLWMALPYAIVMSVTGALAVVYLL